jgi:hypothetical protein
MLLLSAMESSFLGDLESPSNCVKNWIIFQPTIKELDLRPIEKEPTFPANLKRATKELVANKVYTACLQDVNF